MSTAGLSSHLWQPLTIVLSNTPPYLNLDLSWTVCWCHVSDWMPALPWARPSSPRFSRWLLWPSVSWGSGMFIRGFGRPSHVTCWVTVTLPGKVTFLWLFCEAPPISLWFLLWDISRKFFSSSTEDWMKEDSLHWDSVGSIRAVTQEGDDLSCLFFFPFFPLPPPLPPRHPFFCCLFSCLFMSEVII